MCENFDLNTFIKNSGATVAWCNHVIEMSRTHQALWETISDQSEYLKSFSSRQIAEFSEAERSELANKVFEARLELLSRKSIIADESSLAASLRSGELLAFFPTETFNDGTAEVVTGGYFNYFNWPPFSTWVYYVGEKTISQPQIPHLICWIPPEFVDLASDGIDLSPDLSLVRLTSADLDTCYKPMLVQAGLL